jgi:ubiquinone/menaquinone biosynthesis C-methylase UbiE
VVPTGLTGGLPSSAQGYFGSMAESYDSLIHRAVPRYEEMTSRLIEYLPANPGRILELGCGTGNLSVRLAASFPDAALTLVDGSPEMIALVRTRLEESPSSRTGSVVCEVARFEELSFAPASFDLVVSSISLHHVSNKASLYARIRMLLSDGSRFCFADQIRGEPESNHRINWERWLEFCRATGNCSPEEVDSLLDHAAAHDHYTTLSEHFDLLAAAGFSGIDCVWRNWMWGIVTATAA